VIPGLKGEVLAKLPKEAQEAVADFYGAVEERAKKVEASEAAMNLLKQDPYLKSRIEAAEAGTRVQIRGITPKEKETIVAKLKDGLAEELGLEDAEAEKVVEVFGKGITRAAEDIARQMAQDYAAQALQSQESVRRETEVRKQGNDLLRGLSQFNKSLEIKEADLSKFYKRLSDDKIVYNDAHPEIEKFKGGLGKISQWAGDMGITYEKALKMGAEAFYAAAATALKMPVAFNTQERDKKMVGDAVKQKLKPFLKTDGGTLNVEGGNAPQGGDVGAVIINGFNAVKLVEDDAYRAEMYNKYTLQPDKIDELDAAVSYGRNVIEKQSKARR